MSEPVKEIRAAQITMGLGLVDVSRIEHEGRAGILFRPRAIHIPVGEPGELPPGEYWPVDGDVVIWIENEGGAQVIRNYLMPFHCEADIIECLSEGKPFVFDPATNYCHADDGGAPEHGIKYVPVEKVVSTEANGPEAIMADNLLPCPFCCGEPKIIRRAGAFGVKCTCEGKRFLHTYGKTEEAAVTSWNTRDFSPISVATAAVLSAAVLSAVDPALIGIAEEMKESGGHWMPCTGCYDTEDGHPTQKYAYSPALQTDIGCGCHECGGLGAVWWHMTDEELAQFEKDLADIDATGTSGGDHG